MAPIGFCNHHGRTGTAFTCPHISENVGENIKSEKIITASFPVEFGVFELFYCTDCAVEYSFPIEDSEMDFKTETFDEMYGKNFDTICYKCFRELNS